MYTEVAPFVLRPSPDPIPVEERGSFLRQVGQKGSGLRLIPGAWVPPYVVLSAELYSRYVETGRSARSQLLRRVAKRASAVAASWARDWPTGILVRSSAV